MRLAVVLALFSSVSLTVAQVLTPPQLPGQFALWNGTSEIDPLPVAACASALLSVVKCNATLLHLSPSDLSSKNYSLPHLTATE